MNAATMREQRGNGNHDPPIKVDYLEAGSSGPVVMLVHSSVSGARQWRRLMGDLQGQFRVRAVNLFGYGKTAAWPAETIQSLDDQARLVEAALPANADEVYLVGHSFGGSVAMKAAARLEGRVAVGKDDDRRGDRLDRRRFCIDAVVTLAVATEVHYDGFWH